MYTSINVLYKTRLLISDKALQLMKLKKLLSMSNSVKYTTHETPLTSNQSSTGLQSNVFDAQLIATSAHFKIITSKGTLKMFLPGFFPSSNAAPQCF